VDEVVVLTDLYAVKRGDAVQREVNVARLEDVVRMDTVARLLAGWSAVVPRRRFALFKGYLALRVHHIYFSRGVVGSSVITYCTAA